MNSNSITTNKLYDYIDYLYYKNYDNKIDLQCVTSKIKTTINLQLFNAEDFVKYLNSERSIKYFVSLFDIDTCTLGLTEELREYFGSYILNAQKIHSISTKFTEDELIEKWTSDVIDHIINKDNVLTVMINDSFETFKDISFLFRDYSIKYEKEPINYDLTEFLIKRD